MRRFYRLTALMFVFIALTVISNGLAEDDDGSDYKPGYVKLPQLKVENEYNYPLYGYPRSLDPAICFSSTETSIMAPLYETPLTYHYLKRPYELIPCLAEKVPQFTYKWRETGKDLTSDEVKRLLNETNPGYSDEEIAKIKIYLDIKIKKGIYYAPHPCFAKDENGEYKYYNVTYDQIKDFDSDLYNLKVTNKDTRELEAKDFVHQIKRLTGPERKAGIFSILDRHLVGISEFSKDIRNDYLEQLNYRKDKSQEALWEEPVVVDYDKYIFKAAEVLDKYTYRIYFKKPYAKFQHLLTSMFFSPVPKEAEKFFLQKPLRIEYYTLHSFPATTGPFYLRQMKYEYIVSCRNPIYRVNRYPSEGEESDKVNGLLDDAGKKMPFVDKIVRTVMRSYDQSWEEFENGRFPVFNLDDYNFKRFVKFENGKPIYPKEFEKKGIICNRIVHPNIYYLAFNMLDPVWGSLDEDKCKIRRAVAIALDHEEYNRVFRNEKEVACHSPIPPEIFGYEKPEDITYIDSISDIEYYFSETINNTDEKRRKISELTENEKSRLTDEYSIFFTKYSDLNKKQSKLAQDQLGRIPDNDEFIAEVRFGLDWSIYTWDRTKNIQVRRSMDYAKQLLMEAGYENGQDSNGNTIELNLLTDFLNDYYKKVLLWRRSKLDELGISCKIDIDTKTYSKNLHYGKFQITESSWNMDYPDPENFMQMFYSKNLMSRNDSVENPNDGGGDNCANYINPEYDKLFFKMRNMKDSPERLRMIRKMVNIFRRDCPWILENMRCTYFVHHNWLKNVKFNIGIKNVFIYRRLDLVERGRYMAKYSGIETPVLPKNDDDE